VLLLEFMIVVIHLHLRMLFLILFSSLPCLNKSIYDLMNHNGVSLNRVKCLKMYDIFFTFFDGGFGTVMLPLFL
jgi:hypothetical protein